MRQLDSEAKKASANILKSLYESAASVKKQINTDKPEEAPKEEKEALIKKVQKPEVPHKEHIVESEDPFKDEKIKQLQDKVAELQAYLDDTPEVPEDEKTSIQNQIDEMLDEINYLENGLEESSLTEARNPENDEANELIRTSLNDPEYAKNHATELRKHGIKYIKSDNKYDAGALEGKQGRRLAINNDANWRKDNLRDITDTSYNPYKSSYANGYSQEDRSKDYGDLHQKTYKDSKEHYKKAKENIDKQRKKVDRMEKRDKEAGNKWNGKTYDERQKLKDYENTLKRGIHSTYTDSDNLHPDTDLKSFLNAKKHSDRPLARENDPKFKSYTDYRGPRGPVIDPSNKDVEDYKWAKSERRYLDKERERINQSNQEDQDRIEEMKKRAAEEKARREKGYKAQEKDWKNVDTKINKKLDKYRQRMSKNK